MIEEVIPEESETEEEEEEEEATEDSEASHAETTDEDTMASSEKEGKVLFVVEAGLGRIEIQVRSNQVRSQFLALYLVRRTKFLVSCVIKILFAYTRDTFCGSLDTEPVSWFWFADPYFLYRY